MVWGFTTAWKSLNGINVLGSIVTLLKFNWKQSVAAPPVCGVKLIVWRVMVLNSSGQKLPAVLWAFILTSSELLSWPLCCSVARTPDVSCRGPKPRWLPGGDKWHEWVKPQRRGLCSTPGRNMHPVLPDLLSFHKSPTSGIFKVQISWSMWPSHSDEIKRKKKELCGLPWWLSGLPVSAGDMGSKRITLPCTPN